MTATDRWHRIMNHLTTTFLITALVIVVNQGSGVTALNVDTRDQVAAEAKNRAVTIIDGPKYVEITKPQTLATNASTAPNIRQPEQRPPNKPPITPDKPTKQIFYANIPHLYYGHVQKIPQHYPKPLIYHSPNSIYKFPKVIPLPPHLRNHYFVKPRHLMYSASAVKPTYIKSPKFSLPAQTINGIRVDFVKPSMLLNTTTTTTTTTSTEATTTTTTKIPRTKRIWPTKGLETQNSSLHNTTVTKDNSSNTNTSLEIENDYNLGENFLQIRYGYRNITTSTTTQPSTSRGYRPVTRKLKIKSTTASSNFTDKGSNDWVPMMPSHYPKLNKPLPTPINKRSDIFGNSEAARKQMLYLQSFGLVPVSRSPNRVNARKKMVFFKRKRQLNPYYSGYSTKTIRSPSQYVYGDLQSESSHHRLNRPHFATKIKHHHHHHHHRYIKTVEKPVQVPYRVEIPKPYPVTVEKKVPYPVEKLKVVERPVPYPVTVEKKVPYPIGIKVPYPVKVVEKEYIPKPYPIVHHVPVVKHVQVKVPHPVPVAVEKKVPYPVEVKVPVPVDRPVPVPVPFEKQVPYPVPVKVLVPQPYPVETKVPYPVQVKVREPYEVIKHVKVPYPQPYPVRVPVTVHVEKKVPYPVEVEKKVPVRVEVPVPQRIEVEKRVPVYVPKPYPVEKRVPVKVPYPVKVAVKVPVEVPVYIHHPYPVYNDEHYVKDSILVTEQITPPPQHTVTVHGNSGFTGFHSRSDVSDNATTTESLS